MGRTKTAGIRKTGSGYDVDKVYKGERLRQRGFGNFEAAEEWLTAQMDRVNRLKTVGQRIRRTFEEAAAHYLKLYQSKPSITSDVYHLKAIMPYIGHLWLDQIHNAALKPFVE